MPDTINLLTGDIEYRGLSYVVKSAAPTSSDTAYAIPSGWLDTANSTWYVQVSSGNWVNATGVTGPGSATDNAVARFNGTGGETIQNSGVILDDNDNMSGVESFTLATSPSNQATTEGSFYWDATDHCLTVHNDEGDTSLQVGQELITRVRNESGSTITNGQVVYVSGVESGGESRPLISLAQADAQATAAAVGIATHDIENNTYGYIASFGLVKDLNTASFSVGDAIYVSETTAGAFTATVPTSPNFAKAVGYVIVSDAANGVILTAITPDVSGATPTGDASAITILARKASAGTINAGEVVYIAGYHAGSGAITVELADADDASKMPAIGFARASFTNSTNDYVIISGLLTAQDTSAYSVGDQLWVSTTAGAVTNTRPTGATVAVQKMGTVTRSNASNGVINVVGAGRSNDIPNKMSDAYFRIHDDGDDTKLVAFQASGITTGTTRTITMDDADVDLSPNDGTFAAAAGGTQITTLGTIATGTWEATDVGVAHGGTGASTASDARTNLGLAIGSDVQAYDAGLADIAGLAVTDGNIIVGDGANWVAENGATARASLGLTIGTDVQAYDAGLADIAGLAVTDGNIIVGDGANWVAENGATARTSLGLGTGDTPTFTGINLGNENLNDYDEGTFTPTIDAVSSSPSPTYSVQVGWYTRIGNRVTCDIHIILTNISGGSGALRIASLPFTSENTSNYVPHGNCALYNVDFNNSTFWMSADMSPNTTSIELQENFDAAAQQAVNIADVQTTSRFNVKINYSI